MNDFSGKTAALPTLSVLFKADAVSQQTTAVNEALTAQLATLTPPDDIVGLREAYSNGGLGLPASPMSAHAREIVIEGPAGPLSLRVLVPEQIRGVYLHFHGGGWMFGSNDTWDEQFELFGQVAGMVCVSVNYRLAPEHVFPAAIDDCLATARWVIEHAQNEFGTSWLSIGGESAGAHLAASTLIRLREMGLAEKFSAANMLFGVFDLSLTPSARAASGTHFVDRGVINQFADAFAGDFDLRDPAVSPLYADLRNLPPALFTVGSIDPLLDDSLFMYMRWQAAANCCELAVYPGGIHGFSSLDSDLARSANHAMAGYLLRVESENH
ncbi:alpha/beta hydrolase domain-containing protein [Pseudomonas sp. CFII64]|uniref:alpha/beta hydrolase n=1 Tax=Pseudomonas sp. CFII64 TaxID=911242 RepID=UPI0003571D84|nr:alpha/beta hydrolase [Pseudomonas sp. CFII64]EPJ79830.1 alpha/beta hydrolase domain-containing protein [Pseudomonas sp. CFII64]